MLTNLLTCAFNHEVDPHIVIVTLEPTQHLCILVILTLLCAVGFWLEPDTCRYFYVHNSTTMLS